MRVIIKDSSYFNTDSIVGKKVIATPAHGHSKKYIGFFVRGSELMRVGIEGAVTGDFPYFFEEECVEIVQPTMVNCSDSNVGEGWEGFYEQAPIRKSKFRNN